MKRLFFFLASILLLFMGNTAYAVWNSGCTGTNGVLDLSVSPAQMPPDTIVSGTTYTLILPVDGVFNFVSVNIPSGKTVKFQNNAAKTPVIICSQGNVIINGTINVSGISATNSTAPGKGGPGGYDGGFGGAATLPGGKGLGPGGGGVGPNSADYVGGGGGYGTAGGAWDSDNGAGGQVYGNVRIVPLIGGSGGGGQHGAALDYRYGGGGGGGAIIIASSTLITINGTIDADGGNGYDYAGAGSGGAIKIMSDTFSGTGTLSAKGGTGAGNKINGGQGRIRLEANANNFGGTSNPASYPGQPGSVFPASEPSIWITKIGVQNVPLNPTGSYSDPDITFIAGSPTSVTVQVSAQNIPVDTQVKIWTIPQYGNASYGTANLTGSTSSSQASASVTISQQYSTVIMAETTFTMQVAMYHEGEKIEKVRVASKMGGKSESVYISESGKEIPSEVLKLAGLIQ